MEVQNMMIGLWVDDIRESPQFTYKNINIKWIRARSVKEAQYCIQYMESIGHPCDIVSVDHDAGDYFWDGGDYIKLLDWLERTGRNYSIHIHSMNPVGIQNMRAIIRKNNWEEV